MKPIELPEPVPVAPAIAADTPADPSSPPPSADPPDRSAARREAGPLSW